MKSWRKNFKKLSNRPKLSQSRVFRQNLLQHSLLALPTAHYLHPPWTLPRRPSHLTSSGSRDFDNHVLLLFCRALQTSWLGRLSTMISESTISQRHLTKLMTSCRFPSPSNQLQQFPLMQPTPPFRKRSRHTLRPSPS